MKHQTAVQYFWLPQIQDGGKGKKDKVSIAVSQLCHLRVGAHLCLHGPEPVLQTLLSYVGGRSHFKTKPQFSSVFTFPTNHVGHIS